MEHHLVHFADYVTLLVREDVRRDLKRQSAPHNEAEITLVMHDRMDELAKRFYEQLKDPSWGTE